MTMTINAANIIKKYNSKKILLYGDGLNKYIYDLLGSKERDYDLSSTSLLSKLRPPFKDDADKIFAKYRISLEIHKDKQFEQRIDAVLREAKQWDELQDDEAFRIFCFVVSSTIFEQINTLEKNAHKQFLGRLSVTNGIESQGARTAFESLFVKRPQLVNGEIVGDALVDDFVKLGELLLVMSNYEKFVTTNYNVPSWIISHFDTLLKYIVEKHCKVSLGIVRSSHSYNEYINALRRNPPNIGTFIRKEPYDKLMAILDKMKTHNMGWNLLRYGNRPDYKVLRINNYQVEDSGMRMYIDNLESEKTKDKIMQESEIFDPIENAWKNSALNTFASIEEVILSKRVEEVDVFGWDPINDWFIINAFSKLKTLNLYIFNDSIPRDRIETLRQLLNKNGIKLVIFNSKDFIKNQLSIMGVYN